MIGTSGYRQRTASGDRTGTAERANTGKPDGAYVMGISKREEGKKVNSNINVTPMVDVMLELLIIFMVITPMLNNKVNVDLPKADAAVAMQDPTKSHTITVAVPPLRTHCL